MVENVETGQNVMERELRASINEVIEKHTGKVNAMMKPKFIRCNNEDMTITIEFPVLEWELNRIGEMHGGIIVTTFDFAFGILSRFYARLNFSPTINLETTFIKAIPFEESLIITAKVLSSGKTLTHLSADGHLKSSGKLAAIAKATYLNSDTKK